MKKPDKPSPSPPYTGANRRIGRVVRPAEPFSESPEAVLDGLFFESLQLHFHLLGGSSAGFGMPAPSAAANVAASVTAAGVVALFSVRLTFEAVVEGAMEFVVEDIMEEGGGGRERQTNFIIFSSNSAHRGTIRSSWSAHTTKTRSSR
jgi:hypothetical protein